MFKNLKNLFNKDSDDDFKRFNDDEFNEDYDNKSDDNKRDNTNLLIKIFFAMIGLLLVVFVGFRVFGGGDQTPIDKGPGVEESIVDDDNFEEKDPFSFLGRDKEDEDQEGEWHEDGEWLDEDEEEDIVVEGEEFDFDLGEIEEPEEEEETQSLEDVMNGDDVESAYDGVSKVHFIDVGQGDAMMIQSPEGRITLIDGGPRSSSKKLVDYLKLNGVSDIDVVIATHPHEDHIGGLADVLDNFMVERIIMPDIAHTTKTFENLLKAIERNDVELEMAENINTVTSGKDFKNTILYPPNKGERDRVFKDKSNLNLYSVVNRFEFGETSFLFTGDAEVPVENYLSFNKEDYLKSTVLKVGHHGSRTSTSDLFLKKVSPKVAVITSGQANKYNHPHAEVVDKLEKAGVKIYDTKEHGDIVVSSNGKKISVKTSK